MSEVRNRKQGKKNDSPTNTKADKSKEKSKETRSAPTNTKTSLCTYVFFGILLIALSPAIYHQFNSFTFTHNITPPGKLVGISHYGQQMHFYCTGDISNGNYVVILESGTSGSYLEWTLVQKSLLQRNITSCSFDKLGVGFSSPLVSEAPITSQIIADEVKEALDHLGISENIVYVGNFQSGVNALTYSNLHPESVVGLVLVEPIIPTWAALPWFSEFYSTVKLHLMAFKYLNLLGVTPFLPIPGTENLPEPQKSQYLHFLTQYSASAAMEKEIVALTSSLRNLQDLPRNDVPIKLIHASHLATIQYTDEQKKEKFQAFVNFAKQYSNGDVVPLESDYQVQLAYPETVARAIQETVVQLKAKSK